MFRGLFSSDSAASDSRLFLTDAGVETCLIYEYGMDLPQFSSVVVVRSEEGKKTLKTYFSGFVKIAAAAGAGLILETSTWRASPDWAKLIGLTAAELDEANVQSVQVLMDVRSEEATVDAPVAISGCVGPRGDGYVISLRMSMDEARAYHSHQLALLASAGVDVLSAYTMTYPEEAAGIALAARELKMPVVLSFTVETDGRLPSGHTVQEAVEFVDAATGAYPAWFLLNCAHPDHFRAVFDAAAAAGRAWVHRVRGFRVNASRKSHAELDSCTTLDAGDAAELAALCKRFKDDFPWLTVFGGCCGTSHAHLQAIADALCTPAPPAE